MASPLRRRIVVLLVLPLLALAGVAFHGPALTAAVRLYREGWVGRIVLSGAQLGYRRHETDFSLPRALALGVPREALLPFPLATRSTQEEAEYLVPRLEAAGIRSFYVVSSNFHTTRARRTFRRVCAGRMRVLAYPAADDEFQPDSWWRSERGVRVFFLESLKHAASMANL